MSTAEILSNIVTRDEAGRHFTEVYDLGEIEALEKEGLLKINRPVHDTGIQYSQDYWTVEVTEEGLDLLESR